MDCIHGANDAGTMLAQIFLRPAGRFARRSPSVSWLFEMIEEKRTQKRQVDEEEDGDDEKEAKEKEAHRSAQSGAKKKTTTQATESGRYAKLNRKWTKTASERMKTEEKGREGQRTTGGNRDKPGRSSDSEIV